MKLTCPHCGLPAMGAARKLVLGPAADASCRSCGNRVGVAVVRAVPSYLPPLALILAVQLGWFPGIAPLIILALASFLAMVLPYLYWVPLTRRSLTDRAAVVAAQQRANRGR